MTHQKRGRLPPAWRRGGTNPRRDIISTMEQGTEIDGDKLHAFNFVFEARP